jgi:hypothetical protein
VGYGNVGQTNANWSAQPGGANPNNVPPGGANWATGYAQQSKNQLPVNHQGAAMQQPFQQGVQLQSVNSRKSTGGTPNPGTSMGWPTFQTDRPKSATATSNSGNNNGNGAQGNILMTSLTGGGRPTSSNQMVGAGINNWGTHKQGDAGSGTGNSNAYSYGSLKNRFLSGGGSNSKAGSQGQTNARHNGNVSNKSSKLFSLAR